MAKILTTPLTNPDPELKFIISRTMKELLEENDRVLYLDADVMRTIACRILLNEYPDRVFNCGLAEQNMIGTAAGLSTEGFIPFVHSFGCFNSRRVFDQVFMSCAYAGANVKILGTDPGATSQTNGGTHTANEDVAMMRTLPNVTIVDVTDAMMLPQILRQASETFGVFYIRIPRCGVPRVYENGSEFTIGKAETLVEGTDLTIIACGIEVHEAVEAAEILKKDGISARVIDMHTIQPLDEEAVIRAAKETGAIVTAENHNEHGGLGSAVADCVVMNCPVPMERIANRRFGDVGKLRYLMEKYYGISAEYIVEKAKKVLGRKS